MSQCCRAFEEARGSSLQLQYACVWAKQVQVTGDSGFLHTLFNSVNIMCGVGLLATPYAVAQMGWLSLLLLVILGTRSLTSPVLSSRNM